MSLDALRANVERHDGRARTRSLAELGQALANEYWRIGPGTPAAAPVLDEAIRVFDETYKLFDAGDAMRGPIAAQLGWLIGMRHSAHGGADRDRETGIFLLDEALGFAHLPPINQTVARMVLGQLLLSRVTAGMGGAGFAMARGATSAGTADIDRAIACFQQVIDGPVVNEEVATLARTMLTVAEALRTMTGAMRGGPAGVDLGQVMAALATVQNLQQQAATRRPGAGIGFMPNFLDIDKIVAAAPSDRPVAVIDVPVGPASAPPRPPRPAVPHQPTPAAALRSALRDKLGGYASIAALLDGTTPPPGIAAVDEMVALGGALTSAPDAAEADHLLLAVGLYLRSTVDGGGWDADDGADDLRAAGASLLAGARALYSEPADALVAAFRLATRLDERLPAGEVREQLSLRFTEVTRALRAIGADALAYPGIRLTAATGRFAYADGTGGDLSRVLLAGGGPAPDGPVASHVRSAAELLGLAGRSRRAVTEAAVFVANPRRDREHATMDALRLRRTFYPRSIGLGHTVENVDGIGTRAEVRARLTASMLHLGCGITESGEIELAEPDVLAPAEIAAGPPPPAGGVALLPPSANGTGALTEALLAAGHLSVIGFHGPVPDRVASLMYHLLHAELVDEARDPASAVAAVRRRLADSDHRVPEHLPADLRTAVDPAHIRALACWGI